jgi:drug/metabolite transporter (DMT)-like permease
MSIFLLIAVLLWGFSYIAIKVSLFYLTPIEMIAARMVLGSVTLFVVLKIKRMPLGFKGNKKDLFISAFFIVLHFWVMATGMLSTTATNTAWILTTAPIFISLLSFVILKEKIFKKHIIGILLAIIGVIMLVSKGNLSSLDWISSTGDWLVLGSCVTWALYTIAARNVTKVTHPLIATFWAITIAGIVIVPYSLIINGTSAYSMPADGIVAILFLGIGCLAIAFWCWSEGLARKPAGEVGIYLYLEPLFTMIGATILIHERITVWIILGALFIVAAVYVSERRPSKSIVSNQYD